MTITTMVTGANATISDNDYSAYKNITGLAALGIMSVGGKCIDSNNVVHRITDSGVSRSTNNESWSFIDMTVEDILLMLWNKLEVHNGG